MTFCEHTDYSIIYGYLGDKKDLLKSQISIIDYSIEETVKNNIEIIAHGLFDWEKGKLIGCDPLGAVIYAHNFSNKFVNGFPPGWMKALGFVLNVNKEWLCRFSMGYDRNHILEHINQYTGKVVAYDEISKLGYTYRQNFFKGKYKLKK